MSSTRAAAQQNIFKSYPKPGLTRPAVARMHTLKQPALQAETGAPSKRDFVVLPQRIL